MAIKLKINLIISIVIPSLFLAIFLGVITSSIPLNDSSQISVEDILEPKLVFKGNKEITEYYLPIKPDLISLNDSILVTYDLKGVCLYSGPSASLTLYSKDGSSYSVYLAEYGENCLNGEQSIVIPVDDFLINQSLKNIVQAKFSFWHPSLYELEIGDVAVFDSSSSLALNDDSMFAAVMKKIIKARATPRPTPKRVTRQQPVRNLPKPGAIPKPSLTISPILSIKPSISFRPSVSPTLSSSPLTTIRPSPTPYTIFVSSAQNTPNPSPIKTSTPTPSPTFIGAPSPTPVILTNQTVTPFWTIRSVSSMKETKDKICNQDPQEFINSWVGKATELGANYIAVETPYDNPSCGNALTYSEAWINMIHGKGLNVWHRHMPLAFEGIYDTSKDNSRDYLKQISDYIKANPTLFKAGDIFTPIPEPQNGGIKGVTYCPQNICMFDGAVSFNKWLRDAITQSELAFSSIGLGRKMKIGYYGFDGFVAWGDNNPDWDGILEDATIQAMGNITIDHYPEIVGDTMENDLNELQAKYPNTPIIIGEWGTITGGDTISQVLLSMKAAQRKNVIGFNYWHMGMGGNESIINDNFSNKAQFDSVKKLFSN